MMQLSLKRAPVAVVVSALESTAITVTINCFIEGNDDESLFTDRAEIVDPRGRVLIVDRS